MFGRRVAVISSAIFIASSFGQVAYATEAPVTKITNCTHASVPLPKGTMTGPAGTTVEVVSDFAIPSTIVGRDVTVEFEASKDGVASPGTNVVVQSGMDSASMTDVAALAGKVTPVVDTLKLQKHVDVLLTLNSAGTYSGGGKVKFKSCLNESTIPLTTEPGTTLCTTLAVTLPDIEVQGPKGAKGELVTAPIPSQLKGKDAAVQFISAKDATVATGTNLAVESMPASVTVADAASAAGNTIVVSETLKLADKVAISVILGDSGTYSGGGGRVKLSICNKAPLPTVKASTVKTEVKQTVVVAKTSSAPTTTTTTAKQVVVVAAPTTETKTEVLGAQAVTELATPTGVQANQAELARTGVNTFTLITLGSLLMLAGVAFNAIGRRLKLVHVR